MPKQIYVVFKEEEHYGYINDVRGCVGKSKLGYASGYDQTKQVTQKKNQAQRDWANLIDENGEGL